MQNTHRDLTPLARAGVLWLNTCLTVRAHTANSHAKKGWESFTDAVIQAVLDREDDKGVVFLAWGLPAQKTCERLSIDEVRDSRVTLYSYRRSSPDQASSAEVIVLCNAHQHDPFTFPRPDRPTPRLYRHTEGFLVMVISRKQTNGYARGMEQKSIGLFCAPRNLMGIKHTVDRCIDV